MLKRCQKWLVAKSPRPATGTRAPPTAPKSSRRNIVSLLRQQILQVFCADYAQQAQGMYDQYRAHADAYAQGDKVARVKGIGRVPVNTSLLDDLDRYRLGKRSFDSLSDDEKKFRGAIVTLLEQASEKFIRENLPENAGES